MSKNKHFRFLKTKVGLNTCILYFSSLIGLLQLVVTWYMLEGKLPTGTSKTKKIQIYLDEVALFWMSQWAACPPVRTI